MAVDRSVTVFYYEPLLKSGRPCFDARADRKALPGGAIVVGFLTGGNQRMQQVFWIPAELTPAQSEQLEKLLLWVRFFVEYPSPTGEMAFAVLGVMRSGKQRI